MCIHMLLHTCISHRGWRQRRQRRTARGRLPRHKSLLPFRWNYLSKATCLKQQFVFYALFVAASRIIELQTTVYTSRFERVILARGPC